MKENEVQQDSYEEQIAWQKKVIREEHLQETDEHASER